MIDQRLADTVRAKVAGRTHALLQPVGGAAAPINAAIRALVPSLEAFGAHAVDVRQSSMGPLAQGQEINRAAGVLAKSLAEAARMHNATHSRVKESAAASPIKLWRDGTAHYWQIGTGLELAKKLDEMQPYGRASTLAVIRDKPLENDDWLHALLNAPRALSGLSVAEQEGLRRVAFEALQPALFASLTTEMEQVAGAREAIERAIEVAAECGANRAMLASLPEVAAMYTTQPLSWPAARPEDVQGAA